MEIIGIVQGVIFLAVLIYLYRSQERERVLREKTNNEFMTTISDIIRGSIGSLASSQEKLYEEVNAFQDKHFKFSEKQMVKQMDLLHKETKEFMGTLRESLRKEDKITEFISRPVPLETEKVENTIEEQKEPAEYPLSEIDRIPITSATHVQFEGEEEILPVNIEQT